MKWKLLPERPFNWKMKSLDSAQTNFSIDKDGVFRLHIEHDIIKGVTPAMLDWWFRNIKGTMTYQGELYPRYLVWHPSDHIHWDLKKVGRDGKVGVGSQFRIVEALNGNINYLIDTVDTVSKLDQSGIVLTLTVLGIEIFNLTHDFRTVTEGTKYISNMKVGTNHILGRMLLNRLLAKYIFTEEMGRAWLRHNIEEVGNFEFFLPDLHSSETTGS
jgi:hypothetical protein